MKWSHIEGDTDSALVNYANNVNIEDHCTWQSFTLDYILSFYNKKTFRRCIDAGANYGYLSVGFSRYFQNIEAFEISSEIRKHLEINVESFTNITVHSQGLYKENTQVNFKLLSSSGISRITENIDDSLEEVATLDSFGFTDVDLLKIDVERSESELIEGAIQTIKTSLPVIVAEMDLRRDTVALNKRQYILNTLSSLGYTIADIRHNDVLFLVK